MGARVKLPGLGALCEVEWLDAAGHIGADLTEAKPMSCSTVGWLKAVQGDHIIIATSQYTDTYGDFTVIPRGVITKARVIEK
jgi:hypothetical protein